MDYLKKTFIVPYTSEAYAKNWESVFGKKGGREEEEEAKEEPAKDESTVQEEKPARDRRVELVQVTHGERHQMVFECEGRRMVVGINKDDSASWRLIKPDGETLAEGPTTFYQMTTLFIWLSTGVW